jgi:fumarate reductase subunit D
MADANLGAAPVLGRVPNANRPIPRAVAREQLQTQSEPESGLPAWAALLVLLAIAGVGGAIDLVNGTQARGGFNVGIVAASIAAILVVKRSAMFPVVVAPPIVYSLASGSVLYLRSNGLHDHKVVIDTAANWLVYGFPAIAAATASVLIIAGIRMLIRR